MPGSGITAYSSIPTGRKAVPPVCAERDVARWSKVLPICCRSFHLAKLKEPKHHSISTPPHQTGRADFPHRHQNMTSHLFPQHDAIQTRQMKEVQHLVEVRVSISHVSIASGLVLVVHLPVQAHHGIAIEHMLHAVNVP